MRPSPRLLASPASQPFRPGQRAPALALLPPIPLYRRLLRIHRKKLDPEARVFGDTYLKAEFRRHRDIENPLHIVGFLTEWQQYGQLLEGDEWKGGKIDKELLDKMSDQQVGQLYELMQAIQKRGRDSVDEEEEEALNGNDTQAEGDSDTTTTGDKKPN
ncbi:Succinate dehydrogenase assembly factor 3, mitochondrial [Exophiala dermatitidis]